MSVNFRNPELIAKAILIDDRSTYGAALMSQSYHANHAFQFLVYGLVYVFFTELPEDVRGGFKTQTCDLTGVTGLAFHAEKLGNAFVYSILCISGRFATARI